MALVNVGGKINLADSVANIDNKYGPYTSTQEAWDFLGPDNLDVLAIGLTVGIQATPTSPITEYWFKNACETVEDLIPKITGGSGAGTYSELPDKPSINNIELNGDKSLEDLGIVNYDDTELRGLINGKQETLISGTNIKTINNQSMLGEGNIKISGSTSGSTGYSCWENKTYVAVGDSITAGSGTTRIYYNILKDLLGFSKVTGMGVAGSCVSVKSNYGTSNSPLTSRYNKIPEADLITIFMGTNDYGHNTPMGTIDDTTDVSFYGALNIIIPGIMESHPNSRLVWITPTHRDGFGSGFTHDWIPNGAGKTLKDYVDAIKEVCARYSVPVIDLFNISGLHPSIASMKTSYMPDGLHPNANGHDRMAGYISKFLNLYSQDLPEVVGPTKVDVTGVTLSNTSLTLNTNEEANITATVLPANATDKSVTWSVISGSDKITIAPSSLNCKITTKSVEGNAVVRCTTTDGNKIAECTIDITNQTIPVTGIAITGINEITVDTTATLTANITPSSATNKNVTWTITSGSNYVELIPQGITCTIKGIEPGSADITVTSEDGGYTDTRTITITSTPALMWTLRYGNKYGSASQQEAHNRLTPDVENYFFEAGQVLSIDNTKYNWQVATRTSKTDDTKPSWLLPTSGSVSGWSGEPSYTIAKSGYYTIALLNADNSNFDFSVDSNNAFDYITVS